MTKITKPKHYKHQGGLVISAVFSDCRKYRYLLEIKKKNKESGKRVCAIMLNPSIADQYQADKSVQFLEKLIFEKTSPHFKGVTQLSILNLYAFIQTRDFEGRPEHVGLKNDRFIETAISDADIILLAWGKSDKYKWRKARLLEILDQYRDKIILVTKKHPSRGRYHNFIDVFV